MDRPYVISQLSQARVSLNVRYCISSPFLSFPLFNVKTQTNNKMHFVTENEIKWNAYVLVRLCAFVQMGLSIFR